MGLKSKIGLKWRRIDLGIHAHKLPNDTSEMKSIKTQISEVRVADTCLEKIAIFGVEV